MWPNQNVMGTRAEDDVVVGADVAVIPKEFAGVDVGIGSEIGQAESVPGTVQAPWGAFSRDERNKSALPRQDPC